jgi:hypothetical protein
MINGSQWCKKRITMETAVGPSWVQMVQMVEMVKRVQLIEPKEQSWQMEEGKKALRSGDRARRWIRPAEWLAPPVGQMVRPYGHTEGQMFR